MRVTLNLDLQTVEIEKEGMTHVIPLDIWFATLQEVEDDDVFHTEIARMKQEYAGDKIIELLAFSNRNNSTPLAS